MIDTGISIRRFTTADHITPEALAELGPVGGEYVVTRATPHEAQALEVRLVAELLGGDYQLWVNEARTVLVRRWADGSVEIATRPHSGDTWGVPVTLQAD